MNGSPNALLRIALSVLVLASVASCSKKEPAPEEVATAAPELEPVETIVADGETKETSRLWSDAIKSQLAALAESLAEEGSVPEALAATIEIIDPATIEIKEAYRDQSIRVIEMRSPNEPALVESGREEFAKQMRELLVLGPNADEKSVYFKLYGIDREGEHLKTRQRLMTKGARDGKQVRSYAVVDATWVTPTEDGPPSLVSFSMPTLVQNELRFSESQAVFEDVASECAWGSNAAWSEQLQLGMNTWRRNLDRSLSPDFLGYHGVAIADVDGDDLEDVYLCQPGGLPNLLLKQQADGTLVDISKKARVDWLDNTTAALLVDLDNDGDKDLALATRTAFLISENNGKGRFSLRERLSNLGSGYSPTAADYDLDGDLDLLILRYASDNNKTGDFPTPHPFHSARNGGANVLLQNQG